MSSTTSTRLALFTVAIPVGIFQIAMLALYHFHPTVGSFFLTAGFAALLVAALLLVQAVRAFDLTPGEEIAQISDGRRAELQREKKLLLKAIKEVEFDRDMGKVDGPEAAAAVGRYRARAVEVMRLLDADGTRSYEAQIEKELARRLGKLGETPAPAPPAAAAVPDAPSPTTCASCGLSNDADAAFCKKCGTKLAVAS